MKLNKKNILIISLVFLICLFIFSLFVGNYKINFFKGINILLRREDLNSVEFKIFWQLRLPRILMALIIGMLLGSSGAVTQTLFRNPMADPYIIGISASGTFGAVIAYILGLSESYYGIFASTFSFITSFIIFKLSNGKKSTLNLSTLLIVGIAISAFLRALISLAMYLIGEDSFRVVVWTMGYLGGGDWNKILILSIPLVLALIYFYLNRYRLDIILLSDEEAHSLGVDIKKFKYRILIVSTFMIGFSVAFSGMIGFVGLIIPHIVRMIFGSSNIKLIPFSMFYGGIFLLLCDTISRGISTTMEIPIGIITAIFGAPFFIYLAFKSKKADL
ncbi:iron ABC transporter permease [uncultured Cetobacterium sp.]|uniref:FecCD family ABC transporter permease n=1 Tax=uncultured Cetobacterium sp. TaxID=527638 RepID=UPI002609EC59|nr:iron ABC transporter permease [uncultured Cetobacterium sp.]